MPTPVTRYLCDICRREHDTEALALACEASTPERPGLEVGKVYWHQRSEHRPPADRYRFKLESPVTTGNIGEWSHQWQGYFRIISPDGIRATYETHYWINSPADWVEVPGPGEGEKLADE